jgi:hypothetical protein
MAERPGAAEMAGSLAVLAMPMIDPGAGRINVELPAGLSVAEIVAAVLPAASESQIERCRVTLVTDAGMTVLGDPACWSRIRPRPGVRVLVRVIPGNNDQLRSALLIAVSIGAVALGQFWAGGLVAAGLPAAFQGLASAGIAAGINPVGGLYIPPEQEAGGL